MFSYQQTLRQLLNKKIFGCTCFVIDVCHDLKKLDPKSLKCIF